MFETHRTILDSLYWPGGSTFLGGGLRSPVASVVFIAIVVIVTTPVSYTHLTLPTNREV